jgi:hypothetical protein
MVRAKHPWLGAMALLALTACTHGGHAAALPTTTTTTTVRPGPPTATLKSGWIVVTQSCVDGKVVRTESSSESPMPRTTVEGKCSPTSFGAQG